MKIKAYRKNGTKQTLQVVVDLLDTDALYNLHENILEQYKQTTDKLKNLFDIGH